VAQVDAIARKHPHQKIEVWFEDEARLGQQGTISRKWARTGSRPPAVKQTQYDYLYLLGAACPHSGRAEGLIAPHLDTGVVNIFLEQLSQEAGTGVHIVLIWDGAGYHKAGTLRVPTNITLLRLPPYSPELNPMENLWHYLRSHNWSNHDYQHYDALRQAACDAWQEHCINTDLIKTVCHAPYLDKREVQR